MRPNVVIGFVGSTLDSARLDSGRWSKWRPTVSLCMQEDLRVDRLELIHATAHSSLAHNVVADIAGVSPETRVSLRPMDFADPWDFEEVYGKLLDFARAFPFDPEVEDYLVHITTGTHVAQICLFLLTEARYLPARLLQTHPPRNSGGGAKGAGPSGGWSAIDLDLSRYDSIATRFAAAAAEGSSFLKAGIETRNPAFNRMIDEIEQVAIRSRAPLLLMGPTGAGKSQLARRIFELKRARNQVPGAFVEVNCATLKGDSAMSALFGHRKGAFTGAAADRPGLLRTADKGLLFLDEVGELGLDEQAMILRAIEEKRFLPVGADRESASDFQLIAGTNRDLAAAVAQGRFRDDLLARLNLWTFHLPALKDRPEDIAPNLDYELDRFAEREGMRVGFNKEARSAFLAFAAAPGSAWSGNFRDLAAAVTRMATFAPAGRIDVSTVQAEAERLRRLWSGVAGEGEGGSATGAGAGFAAGAGMPAGTASGMDDGLSGLVAPEALAALDPFDRVQLAEVVRTCRRARSLSEAGRTLFAASRTRRSTSNDADRLRKYLQRFGLSWGELGG